MDAQRSESSFVLHGCIVSDEWPWMACGQRMIGIPGVGMEAYGAEEYRHFHYIICVSTDTLERLKLPSPHQGFESSAVYEASKVSHCGQGVNVEKNRSP